ncbi:MAG: ParB/RepB/Spo0J family partition protein [Clostridia bacterium]|nr:ParB/RepB/Spo0J family partition protein [Clostridia bacterium]
MAKKSGLGRGLDVVFMENSLDDEKPGSSTMLRISQIEPSRDQPRKKFDSEALSELADSIASHGLIQPIIVRPSADGFYQIIAGERRWRASKLAGLSEVPVIIRDVDDQTAAQIALIENIQRQDLNPIEEAEGFRSLIEEHSMTQEEAAAAVGKSRSAVTNSLRLLDLPSQLISDLKNGDITAGHARAILGLKNRDEMVRVSEMIKARHFSVRSTEEYVKKANLKASASGARKDPPDALSIDYIADIEHRLMRTLGRKVSIAAKGKKHRITLEFSDEADFEELVSRLDPEILKY